MSQNRYLLPIPSIALCATILLAAGCGGGSGSSSDDGSTIVSRGMITGFGSVYVNNKRFATDSTRFEIDDSAGVEGDLRIGMVVTVRGSSDDDGLNWSADRIDYDNELKGPVSSIAPDPADATGKIAVILGQSVIISVDTVIDDDGGLTFDTIAVDDVLEVSGFRGESGLVATHIELQDSDDEIEIRGYIDNLVGFEFEINGFPISYDGNTELEDIAVLVDGLFVEVEGRLDGSGTRLLADKIEAENDRFDDDADEFEIEGIVDDYDAGTKTFTISGQPVNASGAMLYPATLTLADGVTVEAEGRLAGGVLIADEVKQRGEKTEIDAYLSAVGADTVEFSFSGGDVVVRVNRQTELEDETGNPVKQLSDFNPGDFVELEAFEDGAGVINAVEIERRAPERVEIDAAVQSFDAASRRVTLLGVGFELSAASFEDGNDVSLSAEQFFSRLSPGAFIELEDSDANGVIDKAELDD
jgi:hypothetical protein